MGQPRSGDTITYTRRDGTTCTAKAVREKYRWNSWADDTPERRGPSRKSAAQEKKTAARDKCESPVAPRPRAS